MAAINPALGGSHIEGISDSARARELYKYAVELYICELVAKYSHQILST
jgi:hypothetical protein